MKNTNKTFNILGILVLIFLIATPLISQNIEKNQAEATTPDPVEVWRMKLEEAEIEAKKAEIEAKKAKKQAEAYKLLEEAEELGAEVEVDNEMVEIEEDEVIKVEDIQEKK